MPPARGILLIEISAYLYLLLLKHDCFAKPHGCGLPKHSDVEVTGIGMF